MTAPEGLTQAACKNGLVLVEVDGGKGALHSKALLGNDLGTVKVFSLFGDPNCHELETHLYTPPFPLQSVTTSHWDKSKWSNAQMNE